MDVQAFEALLMQAVRQENEVRGIEWRAYTALGEIPNLNVTEVDIQPQGGTTVLPSAAGTLTIVSSSANDAFGGTGANALLVQGLDENYSNGGQPEDQLYYEEIVLMAGLTPVQASIPLRRVQSLRVVAAGSLGTPAGTITATIGTTQLILRPGDGQTKSARITCPAGWIGYTSYLVVNWAGQQPVRVDCLLRLPNGTKVANIRTDFEQSIENRLGANPLAATFDLQCRAFRVGGGGTDPLNVILPAVFRRLAA